MGSGDPCPGQFCDEDTNVCVNCLENGHCDDAEICTNDFCVAGECLYTNHNGVACDDGQFCTLTDTCSGGACVGSGDPCPAQMCDEGSDACVDCQNNPDCDDGNPCTDDTCVASACVHVNNTDACDDGLFCTDTDSCSGGVCVGSGDPCPGQFCDEDGNACANCLENSDCNDNDVCTNDFCLEGECLYTNNNGAACDDGRDCTTGQDTCSGGICVGTECPDPNFPVCDENSDTCVECVEAGDCDDNVDCTDEDCVGNACQFTPDNAFCADNQFCNGAEFCDPVLDCQNGADPCDDGVGCTDDSCNEGQDECTNTPNDSLCPGEFCDPILDCVECLENTDCDDALPCTNNVCNAGVCEFPLDQGAPACGIVLIPDPVQEGSTGNSAEVPVEPGATYMWTLTNAVCDSGCGTNTILYTVTGPAGEQVHIEVSVEVGGGCNCTDFADVLIEP